MNAVRLALVVGLPIAAAVALPQIEHEATRAGRAFVLAAAWLPAIASALRVRWQVAAASWALGIGALPWTAYMWLAATPCSLSGQMILTASTQCPVQATHFVSAIVGGGSCLALLTGIVSGIRFGGSGSERAHRVYRIALLVAATLMLAWLVSDTLLPRDAPSD